MQIAFQGAKDASGCRLVVNDVVSLVIITHGIYSYGWVEKRNSEILMTLGVAGDFFSIVDWFLRENLNFRLLVEFDSIPVEMLLLFHV